MHTLSHEVARVCVEQSQLTFGLMGNGNAYFLDGIVELGHEFVAVRHESAAVAAADGFYRVGRQLATATVTYGAGFTNMLTALAEARIARTPMVVVVGDQPTTGARPWDVDQVGVATALGVSTITVGLDSPRLDTQRAFDLARVRREPVVLALPYNLASVPVVESAPHGRAAGAVEQPAEMAAHTPTSHEMDAVAELLNAAERPLIIAGDGAREASVALRELADRLDALTATTAIANGMFGNRSTNLGICGGFAAVAHAEVMREADVVLVVGAGLNQFTMAFGHAFGERATVIQIDVAAAATNSRVNRFVHGDATAVTTVLFEAVGEANHERWLRRALHLSAHEPGDSLAADGLLDPRSLTRELITLLPADSVFMQDGGHFSGWFPMYLRPERPGSFHMVGTAFQSIGLGLASALGAQAAAPARTTVLVAGDGGFLMSVADLESVVRGSRNARTVIIIYNDAAYGAEIHQYASRGVSDVPMRIETVDFAGLARTCGAHGIVANSLADLAHLKQWLETDAHGTFVVDARVSPAIVAPYIREITEVIAQTEARNAEAQASSGSKVVQN